MITVDSDVDAHPYTGGDGNCTLREAIINANLDADLTGGDCAAGTGDDAIVFAAGVTNIGLVANMVPISDDADGTTDTLTVDGGGDVTIDGFDTYRPFEITSGATVTLQDLTISYGVADCCGGGILNAGELTVDGVTLTFNRATESGGAIYNTGNALIVDSIIDTNEASGGASVTGGGGITNENGTVTVRNSQILHNFADFGGGIYSSANVIIEGSVISGNEAEIGAGIANYGGSLSVSNTDITDNDAVEASNINPAVGGGILNFGHAELNTTTVADNTAAEMGMGWGGGGIFNCFNVCNAAAQEAAPQAVSENSIVPPGGGPGNLPGASGETLILTDVTVSGNHAAAQGGGIYNDGDVMEMTDSVVSNNTSGGGGGGIFNTGDATIQTSTVEQNQAGLTIANANGGGVVNASAGVMLIEESTIDANTSPAAGGVFNGRGGSLSILKSTISNNETNNGPGGGLFNTGLADLVNVTISGNDVLSQNTGGGIFNCTSSCTSTVPGIAELSLLNVTVANNSSVFGGGIHNDDGGSAEMQNTLFDANAPTDCEGVITSLGNNLDSDDTCGLGAGGDIPAGDANLGPLADNGGFTQTHALLPGSDAIDEASNAACPDDDQRGVDRPQDGDQNGSSICDIGAYEVEGPEQTPTPTVTSTPTATPTPAPARITITKELLGVPGLNFDEFGFEGDLGGFVLMRGESESFEVAPGEYEVTESHAAGFVLQRVDCDGGDVTTVAGGVQVEVDAGDEVECVFYNARPNVSGIGYGPPPAQQAPAQATPSPAAITPPSTGSAGLR